MNACLRVTSFALALLAFLPAIARAADPAGGPVDYSIASWSRNDGRPAGSITALAAATVGPLWVGMDSGLYSFDGMRFARTSTPQSAVTTLTTTHDDSVWVGFADGRVVRITATATDVFGPESGLPSTPPTVMLEDASHVLWLGGRSGLYRFDEGTWTRVTPAGLPDSLRVTAAAVDPAGILLLSAGNAVYRQDADRAAFHTVSSFDSFGTPGVIGICASTAGRVYVTDPVNGFTVVGPAGGPASPLRSIGRRLLCDRRGNVWVGTGGGGLWRVHPETEPTPVPVETGLLGEVASAIAEDARGNIWVGTPEGLHRLTPNRMLQITDLGVSTAVATTPDGHVWVGTLDGLVEFSQPAASAPQGHRHLQGSRVRALHTDSQGTLWVGTNAGIMRFSGDRDTATPVLIAGAFLQQIESLSSGPDGELWVADGEKGVFRLRAGALEPVTLPFDVGQNPVSTIHVDRSGRTWMGLDRGVAVRQPDGRVDLYDASKGFDARRSRAILEDESGTVWIGGVDSLSWFTGDRFSIVHQADGFPVDWVKGLGEDSAGNLWLAGATSIVRIARAEFEQASDPRTRPYSPRYERYDQTDGSGTPRVLGDRSVARTTAGVLWFTTGNGVTRVEPQRLRAVQDAPIAAVIGAVADGEARESSADAAIASGTKTLRIDYTALNLDSPHRTRFQYRLVGFDDRWEDADARLTAFYTNLPPGAYEFQVSASNEGHGWTEPTGRWAFTVRPAFYQASWFPFACAAVLALFGWGGWRLRLAQVRKQFAIVLGERVRLSREIHDTLLQSMVGVAVQCEVLANAAQANPVGTRDTLLKLRRQVESHIREFRQSISDLRAERDDFLSALRAVGDATTQVAGVNFDLVVHGRPRPSTEDVERQLLKIAREAVSNAARHGRPKSISVDVGYDAASLRLRIRDDGRGFDPEESTGSLDGHCGLMSMRERAAAIGAKLSIASEIGRGTLVEAIVPLGHG